jgi:hypothetical protein
MGLLLFSMAGFEEPSRSEAQEPPRNRVLAGQATRVMIRGPTAF